MGGTPYEELAGDVLRSPLWDDALRSVETAVAATAEAPVRARDQAVDRAVDALTEAHGGFHLALDGLVYRAEATDPLVRQARRLMTSACEVLDAFDGADESRRPAIASALVKRLSERERGALAGELTYALTKAEATEPATRLREILAALGRGGPPLRGDLLALELASVELAALLIRAVANLQASGSPAGAAEERVPHVDRVLELVVGEVIEQTSELTRAGTAHDRDVVAHHLARALRAPISRSILSRIASTADPDTLRAARAAWLQLASHELRAVSAVERELDRPAYAERFGSLEAAITEGAANVLYGARLTRRPAEFRHRKAWASQSVTLTYALEAYVRGLRGMSDGFAQTQLIVLTRLVRAVTAIVVIDLRRPPPGSPNGASP